MIAVARRYTFWAHHHVEGAPEPWCNDHGHTYTVEVVAEGDSTDRNGMVIDTDLLDRVWSGIVNDIEGTDLNATTAGSTTVEDLAQEWLSVYRAAADTVVEVKVFEDDERWGRARA